MQIPLCYEARFLGLCYKNFDTLGKMGNKESFGGVSEKKGKVRVRGKVNLAVSRKRSVVEQNGIKISSFGCKGVLRNHLGEFQEKRIRLGVRLRKKKSVMGIEPLTSSS